jgi:hypothetical protein
MTVPDSHGGCAEFLRALAASLGSEVTVSTVPPPVVGPYGVDSFTCPHETEYFIEPTVRQIAAWVLDGVR